MAGSRDRTTDGDKMDKSLFPERNKFAVPTLISVEFKIQNRHDANVHTRTEY